MTVTQPLPTPTLTVVYKCMEGHHEIRSWRIPIAVPSDVLCSACGGVSVILHGEKERHKRAQTGLGEWLLP